MAARFGVGLAVAQLPAKAHCADGFLMFPVPLPLDAFVSHVVPLLLFSSYALAMSCLVCWQVRDWWRRATRSVATGSHARPTLATSASPGVEATSGPAPVIRIMRLHSGRDMIRGGIQAGMGIITENTVELRVVLTAREARALANAAAVTAAVVRSGRGAPAGPALETAADKLRLALVEIGEPPT